MYITGNATLSDNTAEKNGGVIFLYQSELKCQDNGKLFLLGNVAGERGGAIHAISSSIGTAFNVLVVDINGSEYVRVSQIIFTDNHAIKGGAVSLEVSTCIFSSKLIIMYCSLTYMCNLSCLNGMRLTIWWCNLCR